MSEPGTTSSSPTIIRLGHITGVYGLQGWVKVHSDTDPRENIVSYKSWLIERAGVWREIKVLAGRPQGKTIVARLDGISSSEQAAILFGSGIAVERESLASLNPGEYYWADLVGMQVRTVEGAEIGPVNRLFETGANDVMVVSDWRGGQVGNKEVLVPWLVPEVITEVNTGNRVITVDWDPDF